MPRGCSLSESEQTQIKILFETGSNIKTISERIKRHRNTITNFLKNPNNYCSKQRNGRKPTVDNRGKREIRRLAVSKNMSAGQIKHQLGLTITKRRVQQILSTSEHLLYRKRLAKPKLSKKHKVVRMEFAEAHKFWDDEWQSVIFSDEKKFNLDGPDGYQMSWQDLRVPRPTRCARNFQGGSLMLWAAFGYRGKSNICFISNKMNAERYVELLDSELIEFAGSNYGDSWIFQQDNAPIHNARHTKKFFEERNIPVLKWPAVSPDLNPIENLWGILSKAVYNNGRQFDNLKSLKTAIVEEWAKLDEEILRRLIDSMPRRITSVQINRGNHTKY